MASCDGASELHSSGATIVTSGALRLRGEGSSAEKGLGVKSQSGIGTEADCGAKDAPLAPITSRRPPAETNRETAARSALVPCSEGSAKIKVVSAASSGSSSGGDSQRSTRYPDSCNRRNAAFVPNQSVE